MANESLAIVHLHVAHLTAGLVYFHYGRRVLAEIVDKDESDDLVKPVYKKVYDEFVEAIDVIDNGILPMEGDLR